MYVRVGGKLQRQGRKGVYVYVGLYIYMVC